MKLLALDTPSFEEIPLEETFEMTTDIPGSIPAVEPQVSPMFGIVLMVIYLAVIVLMAVTMWRIFAKAGKPGWAAIVPIYNLIVLFQIIGKPAWWIILLFIPFVNIAISIIMSLELAKVFGKTPLFGIILLWFLPVGYFVLAFGNAKYTAPGKTSSTPAPAAPASQPAAQPPTPAA